MELNMKKNVRIIVNGLLAAALIAACTSASAEERHRSGSFETSGGRDGTFQQDIKRTPGSKERDTTAQTANGAWNRKVQDNWNRQTGTANRNVVTTAPRRSSRARRVTAIPWM